MVFIKVDAVVMLATSVTTTTRMLAVLANATIANLGRTSLFTVLLEASRHGERREGRGWTVEWEIVEWTDGEEASGLTPAGGKRKLGDIATEEDDIRME